MRRTCLHVVDIIRERRETREKEREEGMESSTPKELTVQFWEITTRKSDKVISSEYGPLFTIAQ
jgi:hypothetical protein